MAQSAATSTGAFSGFLNPEVSQNYFAQARKTSTVMQLARQIPLGINGQEIPYSTAKAKAGWVSEGGRKPSTESGLALKTIKPYKLAAISVVSAEVVRANPGNYMQILRDDIAESFAVAFDEAALHGTDTPFGASNYIGSTSKAVELGTTDQDAGGTYGDVVAGLKLLVDDGKSLNGFAFDKRVEPEFLGAVDTVGRPLFIDTPPAETTPAVTPGRLIGRPAYLGDNVYDDGVLGFGGDWSQVVWGVVGGITFDVSTETTVTLGGELVSTWENNLVAIRAEAEFGLLVNDPDSFVKYTESAGGGEG